MKKILYFLFLLVALISCRKEEKQDAYTLPDATQTGSNTGGALINGQVWVAKKEFPSYIPGTNNTFYTTDPILGTFRLEIVLRQYKNESSHIAFYIEDNQDFSPQTYVLDSSNRGSYSPSVLDDYITDSTHMGTLTITKFDKVNKIVSGTFTFKAINSTGEVVNITEGRFDRKYSL